MGIEFIGLDEITSEGAAASSEHARDDYAEGVMDWNCASFSVPPSLCLLPHECQLSGLVEPRCTIRP